MNELDTVANRETDIERIIENNKIIEENLEEILQNLYNTLRKIIKDIRVINWEDNIFYEKNVVDTHNHHTIIPIKEIKDVHKKFTNMITEKIKDIENVGVFVFEVLEFEINNGIMIYYGWLNKDEIRSSHADD
jgi:hypothetical protein